MKITLIEKYIYKLSSPSKNSTFTLLKMKKNIFKIMFVLSLANKKIFSKKKRFDFYILYVKRYYYFKDL